MVVPYVIVPYGETAQNYDCIPDDKRRVSWLEYEVEDWKTRAEREERRKEQEQKGMEWRGQAKEREGHGRVMAEEKK